MYTQETQLINSLIAFIWISYFRSIFFIARTSCTANIVDWICGCINDVYSCGSFISSLGGLDRDANTIMDRIPVSHARRIKSAIECKSGIIS